MENEDTKFVLSNAAYDLLKSLVQFIIPALSSLYFGLAQIWDLPAAEKVVGTLALIATFLGVFLRISTKRYNKSELAYEGNIVVTQTEDGKLFSLELKGDPEEILESAKSVRFKVTSQE